MKKEIWVTEGLGEANPSPYNLTENETIGEFKRRYAEKFDVPTSDIQAVTDSGKRLTDDGAKLSKFVKNGESVQVLPRAKGG